MSVTVLVYTYSMMDGLVNRGDFDRHSPLSMLARLFDFGQLTTSTLNNVWLCRTCVKIFRAWKSPSRSSGAGNVTLPILEEYAGVLMRPRINIRKGERLRLLQLIKNRSYIV
jgi:hypothetical protein